jgi:hypothetical protein
MTPTPLTREQIEQASRELVTAARENHGVRCTHYTRMPVNLATGDCARCGRSSTAHVVTMLCDTIDALLAHGAPTAPKEQP